MRYDEFLKEVQTRGGLERSERAEQAALAALPVLAERLATEQVSESARPRCAPTPWR